MLVLPVMKQLDIREIVGEGRGVKDVGQTIIGNVHRFLEEKQLSPCSY